MRKVIVGAFVSMDGVMRAPGGRTKTPPAASSTVLGRADRGRRPGVRRSDRAPGFIAIFRTAPGRAGLSSP
jgi:hypothetical protein